MKTQINIKSNKFFWPPCPFDLLHLGSAEWYGKSLIHIYIIIVHTTFGSEFNLDIDFCVYICHGVHSIKFLKSTHLWSHQPRARPYRWSMSFFSPKVVMCRQTQSRFIMPTGWHCKGFLKIYKVLAYTTFWSNFYLYIYLRVDVCWLVVLCVVCDLSCRLWPVFAVLPAAALTRFILPLLSLVGSTN